MFPQRRIDNLEYIRLCPSSAQRGGEGGRQSAPGHLWCWAEAPRQRPGEGEPRPPTASRPNQIRLRTESVYGILVMLYPIPRSVNGKGMMKPNRLISRGRCRSVRIGDHHHTVIGDDYHPGKRRSLSLNGELLGTWESFPPTRQLNPELRGARRGWEEVGDTVIVCARESRVHGKGCQPIR
jgi:hypothetical protein